MSKSWALFITMSNKKKSKGKKQQKQVATSTKTQMNDFASKFEKDFSMASFLSSSTNSRNAWYVDSGASQNMTSARQLFSILKEHNSGVQIVLSDDANYPVVRVVLFLSNSSQGTLQILMMFSLSWVSRKICFQFHLWTIRTLQQSSRTTKSLLDQRSLPKINTSDQGK